MADPTPIAFAYNHTSWDAKTDAPRPGGMADCLVQPILPHLETPYELTRMPLPGFVNVYYAHRHQYRHGGRPVANIRHREQGVFASHGIADKAWRNQVGNAYEFIFVSGPAWSLKMISNHCPIRKIVEVGYAKLDPIINGEVPGRPRDGRIRVVWAPTHGGGGQKAAMATESPKKAASFRSSWWEQDAILELLPESEFEVIIAPHPRHRLDKKSTLDEYVDADVVIADGGSTIYEAWALDLPVVFPDWLVAKAQLNYRGTFEEQIYRDKIGGHVDDPSHLAQVVTRAAERGITDPEQKFIEPILPRRYRGSSGRLHAEALDEIAATGQQTRHAPKVSMVRYQHRAGRTVNVAVGSKQERSYRDSKWWEQIGAA